MSNRNRGRNGFGFSFGNVHRGDVDRWNGYARTGLGTFDAIIKGIDTGMKIRNFFSKSKNQQGDPSMQQTPRSRYPQTQYPYPRDRSHEYDRLHRLERSYAPERSFAPQRARSMYQPQRQYYDPEPRRAPEPRPIQQYGRPRVIDYESERGPPLRRARSDEMIRRHYRDTGTTVHYPSARGRDYATYHYVRGGREGGGITYYRSGPRYGGRSAMGRYW